MSTPPNPEEAIVDAALEMPAHERAAYLDKLCGNDPQLRQLVDALLHAHKKIISSQIVPPRELSAAPTQSDSTPAEGAPERRAPGATTMAVSVTPIEKPGDHIGRYKLLEQIGEGGFGVVYVAEQREPVKRRVALKIVKLGMDTRQVVGRFEAERQALALMDHPNIAKVFDGGATEAGRPYFVMELVRGIKITDYCDQNNLPTIQRLELFIQTCRAIQHAHQKGIIHRDIKPSNILVTLHDGVPVPKVIDFGIAKATQQELTEKTVYTQLQQFIGTPAYMSPEQAEMSGLDIDTRSDIYSLGVLLYELLTGKTPFDGEKLVKAGLDEVRRIIREQEPPRPSTCISTLTAEEQTTVARRRQSELPKLVSQIRGDLDWIAMKCLEKDRSRRYETATGIAAEIECFLKNEPVTARPPSRAYRFQKLVRRNKLAFAAAGAVATALVGGLAVSAWSLVNEQRARHEADRQRHQAEENQKKSESEAAKSRQVAQFLRDMLASVAPSVALGRDATMLREILDRTAERVGKDLSDQPEVEAELRNTLGSVYYRLGEFKKAEIMLRGALALRKKLWVGEHAMIADSLTYLGLVLGARGDLVESEAVHREALRIRRKLLSNEKLPDNEDLVSKSCDNLGVVLERQGRLPEAETFIREGLAIQRRLMGNESEGVAVSLANLGVVLRRANKLAEAEANHTEALKIRRKVLGMEHPDVATSLNMLANALRDQGKFADAEIRYREALAMRRKLLGSEHPSVAQSLDHLATDLQREGKLDEAEQLSRESLRMRRKLFGDTNLRVAESRETLSSILRQQGKLEEAEALNREALAMQRKRSGEEPRDVAASPKSQTGIQKNQGNLGQDEKALLNLTQILIDERKFHEAEDVARETLTLRERNMPDTWLTANTRSVLGGILLAENECDQAELLLLAGYQALKKQEGSLPETGRDCLRSALVRLVQLYEATGQTEKLDEWKQKLKESDSRKE